MKKNFMQNIVMPYLIPCGSVMVVLSLVLLYFRLVPGLIALAVTAAVIVYSTSVTDKVTLPRFIEYEAQLLNENDQIMSGLKENDSLPLCAVNMSGRIYWENDTFAQLRRENGTLQAVLGKDRLNEFFSDEKSFNTTLSWGDRSYSVNCSAVGGQSIGRLLIWRDITSSEKILQLYKDRKCCVAYLSIDNYDEIIADTPAEDQSQVEADIDKCIRNWASELSAAVIRYKSGSYTVFFEQRFLPGLREGRFRILNDMHEIVTGADFPTSLSIGVGWESSNLDDLQTDARNAMELAIGRGGDQAVIGRINGDNEYYGGALATVEKRNKGKSRMIAHALLQQMNTSDRIVIMGHSRPDMDSIGSSIGLYHLTEVVGKEAHIVLNGTGEAIQQIYDAAVQTERYSFMTGDELLPLITKDTLLILTDCHSGFMAEDPRLAEAAERKVVIDHHRRSKGAIENPTLSHTEVYASSASELVTELLQYSGKKAIDKFAAGALLAGITVDTKNFTVNTGVRTFEAASWLRRNGADSTEVKNYFKLRLDFVQKKYNIIASAEILGEGIAVAYTKESDESMQVLAAQAADELLEMQGVRAAFTAGKGPKATMVSARSNGQINVQTIMEKLGGGGHMNVAAAQVQDGPEEAILRVVEILRAEGTI